MSMLGSGIAVGAVSKIGSAPATVFAAVLPVEAM